MLSARNRRSIGAARSLRGHLTSTESLLWRKLRNRRFQGCKFRRQYPIGPWIADFACPRRKIIVEIDGGDHRLRKTKDRRRDERMRAEGFLVLRFTGTQVRESLEWVLERICMAVEVDRSN